MDKHKPAQDVFREIHVCISGRLINATPQSLFFLQSVSLCCLGEPVWSVSHAALKALL